jgi:hypothetical protein
LAASFTSLASAITTFLNAAAADGSFLSTKHKLDS